MQIPTMEQLEETGAKRMQWTDTFSEWVWRGHRWEVTTYQGTTKIRPTPGTIRMESQTGDFWAAQDDLGAILAMDVWDHYDDYIQSGELSDFVKAAMARGNVVTF